MKILKFFSKPAWESNNPIKRQSAIATSQHAELLALLPKIAQNDPDSGIRISALGRLEDPNLFLIIALNDQDLQVRSQARQKLISWIANAENAADLALAETILPQLSEATDMESIASNAKAAKMRLASLQFIHKQSFLAGRCLNDPTPAVRLSLVERLESSDTLERLADSARKSDKNLANACRVRAEKLKLAQGDPATIELRAQTICSQLQSMLSQRDHSAQQTLANFEDEWKTLEQHLSAELNARFHGLLNTTKLLVDASNNPSDFIPDEIIVPAEKTDAPLPDTMQISPQLTQLFSEFDAINKTLSAPRLDQWRTRWANEWKNCSTTSQANLDLNAHFFARLHQHESEIEQAAAKQELLNKTYLSKLADYEIAIKQGRILDAASLRDELKQQQSSVLSLQQSAKHRLATADSELGKLNNWQRWSNEQALQNLCKQAQDLIGSGMHPDALLNAIRDLQAQWRALESKQNEHAGLARKFNSTCQKAIAPAKPYFEKRHELREEHQQSLSSFVEECRAAISNPKTSFATFYSLRRRTGEYLRGLDSSAPQTRSENSKLLRDVISEISQQIQLHSDTAAAAKREFLKQLNDQIASATNDVALVLAKKAVGHWKKLAHADRKTDQILWHELSSLIDPVFKQQDEIQRTNAATRAANSQAQVDLIEELNQLAQDQSVDSTAMQKQIEAASRTWITLADADASHQLGFDQAIQLLKKRIEFIEVEKRRLSEQSLSQALNYCNQWEDSLIQQQQIDLDAARANWEALTLPSHARKTLQERFNQIADVCTADDSSDRISQLNQLATQSGLALALRAEFFAGVASPTSFQQQRREYQVQRLAASLRGEQNTAAGQEAQEIKNAWHALGWLSNIDRQQIGARVSTALKQAAA